MKKISAIAAILLILASCAWHCVRNQTRPESGSTTVEIATHDSLTLLLNERLIKLEERDKPYEEFFKQLEGMTGTFSTFFTILSVILAVISAVMLGIQVWASIRESKMMEELRNNHQQSVQSYQGSNKLLLDVIEKMQKNFQESMKSHEESNKNLLNAVIDNIGKTTSFINSYEQLLHLKETAEEIREKQKQEDEKRKTEKLKAQKSLNAKAMRLIKSAFEANFGASYFNDYDRAKFNSFFVEMNSRLATMEGDDEAEKNWNADVYFLMGLNQFLSGQSRDAEKYLEIATQRVESFIELQPQNTEMLFPERELFVAYDGINGWNKMLYTKCAFYSGLNHYRLGRFHLAISEFEKALKYASKEIDPWFLLYQSRYWANELGDFPKAMKEMASLSTTIDSDSHKVEKARKMVLARLYKKIGDFYLPSDDNVDTRYAGDKDTEKALEWYKKAYEIIQKVNGQIQNIPQGHSQFVPMAYFALGNALKKAGKSKPESPENLFKKTEEFCEQAIPDIQNPETRYILYYTLAYAQHQLGEHRQAGYNIALALVELERFCSNPKYYGYSPVNNIMIPSQHLKDELNTFKRKLFDRV